MDKLKNLQKSWGAKGLFSFIHELQSSDYIFNFEEISKSYGIEIETTEKYLQELLDKGYLIRYQLNVGESAKKNRSVVKYMVFWEPIDIEKIKKDLYKIYEDIYLPDLKENFGIIK